MRHIWNRFLDSPKWQFAGAVIGVIAIVAGIWFFRVQNHKALSYGYLSSYLASTDQISGTDADETVRLEILFENEPIPSVHSLLIKVENTGSVPIRSADFETPIMITLPENKILGVPNIAEAYPSELRGAVKINLISAEEKSEDVIAIEPLLLNSGDWFLIRLFVLNEVTGETIQITSRIAGIREITQQTSLLPSERSGLLGRLGAPPWESVSSILAGIVAVIASIVGFLLTIRRSEHSKDIAQDRIDHAIQHDLIWSNMPLKTRPLIISAIPQLSLNQLRWLLGQQEHMDSIELSEVRSKLSYSQVTDIRRYLPNGDKILAGLFRHDET